MNKLANCNECACNNLVGEPICQTCIAGSHFSPKVRNKIYYQSAQEMLETPGNESFIPEIINVIFREPATIIFWADGTKTVVKAVYDEFDPEKGLTMAITKKALGNKGNYFNVIKKWIDEYLEKEDK